MIKYMTEAAFDKQYDIWYMVYRVCEWMKKKEEGDILQMVWK